MVSYKVRLLLLHTGSHGLQYASYKNKVYKNVLAYCKPRDPVGSNNRCTLYDIFYMPEDDPMGSKREALLTVA